LDIEQKKSLNRELESRRNLSIKEQSTLIKDMAKADQLLRSLLVQNLRKKEFKKLFEKLKKRGCTR